MTETINTEIDGYEVCLELHEAGEPLTECWVAKPNSRGMRAWCSSLSCLQGTGELAHHADGAPHTVPQHTTERIAHWAEQNGY